MQGLSVGDTEVDESSRPARVVGIVWLEVQLHRSSFDEAIPRRLVEFCPKAQLSIPGKSNADVFDGEDWNDALEDDLGHRQNLDGLGWGEPRSAARWHPVPANGDSLSTITNASSVSAGAFPRSAVLR